MRPRSSVTGPLLLILLGVVFLLNSLSPGFRVIDLFWQYWPYLLIVWGAVQLVEVIVRFGTSRALPVNGISAGGWFFAFLISVTGLLAYQAHRIDPWWQHGAFLRGVEAFGQEHEYSVETMQKPCSLAPRVVIENFRGDAKITVHPAQSVTLTGRKLVRAFEEVEAARANQSTPVELLVEGDTVIVRAHQDKADSRTRVVTNMEISVPVGASVEATGTYGDFDISGLHGRVDISSDNAGVRLQDLDGDVKVQTRQSDLIRCANIKGAVELRGHGKDVELSRVGGEVNLNGAFTGSVSLRDLAKPVHVQNLRTECELRQVVGEFRMEHGNVNLENVVGPIRLNSHATDVKLENFSDSLDLSVDRGDIELRPAHLPLGRMMVHTRSGNIELEVPQTAGFVIEARTISGQISNDFRGSLREETHGRGSKLEGTVGSGPDVKLETQRGSISIRKNGSADRDDTDASLKPGMLAKVD